VAGFTPESVADFKSESVADFPRNPHAFLSLGVEVWDFEMADAEHAGEIRAVLERNGTPIGLYDCLIAAQARRRGAVLVTLNKREFSRVPGLVITDWTQ
jgi:tRNA(fMet)-specific endonuclease VapC